MARPKMLSIRSTPRGIAGGVDLADLSASEYLADCLNIRLDDPAGGWSRRAGSVAYNSTESPLGNDLWNLSARIRRVISWAKGDGKVLLIVIADTGSDGLVQLYYNEQGVDTAFTPAGDPFYCAGIPSYAILFDRVWIATGASEGGNRCFDGESVYGVATLDQPNAPSGYASGTNYVNAQGPGVYSYAICYRHAVTLACSAMSPSVAITVASYGQIVNLTIPYSTNAQADLIDVYRTTAGGAVLRKLRTVANDTAGGTVTVVDAVPDSKLSFELAPDRSGYLPACRFVTAWHDRLWWSGRTEGDLGASTVYHTDAMSPFNVDPVLSAFEVNPDDGDPISGGCAPLGEQLYALKGRNIYGITEVSAGVFMTLPIITNQDVGPINHAVVQMTRGGLLWMSRSGLILFNGVNYVPIHGPLTEWMTSQSLNGAASAEQPGHIESRPTCTFTNTDIVAERFHFAFEFRAVGGTEVLLTLSTQEAADRPYILVDGATVGATGRLINPGVRCTIQVNTISLPGGADYEWSGTVYDGLETSGSREFGTFTQPVIETIDLGNALERLAWYWTLNDAANEQIWIAVAGGGSQTVDQVWVFDYGSFLDGSGGSWWRHHIFGTAGCMGSHVSMAGEAQAVVPYVGDGNGMVWVHRAAGGLDHDTGVEMSEQERTGEALLVDNEDGTWLLVRNAAGWSECIGMVVVVRDRYGTLATGLISSCDTDTLTICAWSEGIVPLVGDVSIWIGGINAWMQTLWLPGGSDGAVKVLTGMELIRGEPAQTFDVALTASNVADDLKSVALPRWLKRSLVVTRSRDAVMYRPVRLRGRVFSLVLGNREPAADWSVRELRLKIEPTDGA